MAEEALALENRFLCWIDAPHNPNWLNHHPGGEGFGGKAHSEETKQKLRGRKLSEDTKQKIREKRKLQVITKETKRKQAEAGRRRKQSTESRAKLSATRKEMYRTGKLIRPNFFSGGKPGTDFKHPFLGKKHSEESREKMRESRKRYCEMRSRNG